MARPAQGHISCHRHALPKDLPPRSTVHDYFVRWQCDGPLGRLHHALYEQARELAGKEASPTTAIVDSQSVKGAERGGARPIRWAMTQLNRVYFEKRSFSSSGSRRSLTQ